MGLPRRYVRDAGKAARASSNAMKHARAKWPRARLVKPGSAFCSCTAVGMRISHAVITNGPLAYPPTPTTTSGSKRRRIRRDCQTDRGRRKSPNSVPRTPCRLSGATSISSSGKPFLGTMRVSRPRAVPTKSTSLRGWRVFTSSARARPGKRWPPVPPPAMSILIAPAPSPDASRGTLEDPPRTAAHRQQDAGADQRGDYAAHSVGKEGQRHPLRGQERKRHSRVHQRLERQEQRDPERDVAAERLGSIVRRLEPAPDDHREQQEHATDADETQLLSDDAEDEVRVGGREEEQLLVAAAQSHAARAAGAEGEQRLDGLVAVTARVRPGVQEREDAPQPVGRVPHEKDGDRGADGRSAGEM